MLSEEIKNLVRKAASEPEIPLEQPSDKSHGEYSTSIALKLAKQQNISPREFATELVSKIDRSDLIKRIEIAGPGFINFHLSKKALRKQIARSGEQGEKFGNGSHFKGKKIMVEFAHPNTHKAFHIGHLRTLNLGESLARILTAQGATVFRANYQGDVGLHVAKCLWGYMHEEEPQDLKTPQAKTEFLGKVYAKGAQTFEKDENAKEEIYEINKKIYAQDPEIMPLWKKTRQWSLDYFDYSYERFGTFFDRLFFESEVYDLGRNLVLEHLDKGVFEKSEGAVIFPGEKHGLHNRVFITGEGNPTYEAKEMGLAKLEQEAFPFDLNIHVVGNEQAEYFRVVIEAMNAIYPELKDRQRHLAYGMVNLASGKMSSRTGEVITAEFLIEEVKKELAKVMKESDMTDEEKTEVMEKVAIGGIKFIMLFGHAKNDIAFDMEKAVRLDGDSGPYLQYAYARISSILSKVESSAEPNFDMLTESDWDLARKLNGFEYAVTKAAEELSPHYIAHYLLELASEFSGWYGVSSVKNADTGLMEARIELLKSVRQVIRNGLYLMGIEVLQKM